MSSSVVLLLYLSFSFVTCAWLQILKPAKLENTNLIGVCNLLHKLNFRDKTVRIDCVKSRNAVINQELVDLLSFDNKNDGNVGKCIF